MTGLIFNRESMGIIASYANEDVAIRMLKNAKEKGHKLQGRKYRAETLDKLAVCTPEVHRTLDTNVEVRNLMSGKPVLIKRSEVGTCVDPSTERYWSM